MPTVACTVSASRYPDVWSETSLTELRERLRRDGFFQLTGLPDEFEHAEFAARLGTPVPQYDGRLIWDIAPRPEFESVYHSLNQLELFPHTECYEFPGVPPRYLCLWCVRPDEQGLAMTFLGDVLPFVESLSPDELLLLRSTTFSFQASAGIKQQGLAVEARHSLLERTSSGREIVRMSLNNLYDLDGNHAGLYKDRVRTSYDTPITRVLEKFETYFNASHHQVRWTRGDFLIWDNQRLAHSRPSFQDPKRLLKRMWLSEATEGGTNAR